MKIFETSFDLEFGRTIYTNNPFKLLSKISRENKDLIIITPFNKVKDIINFTKSGGLETSFAKNNIYIENLLNINSLNSISEEYNAAVGANLLQLNLDSQKFLKNIFDLTDENVSELNINYVLEFVNENFSKLPPIVVVGFDDIEITKKVPHMEVISNFKNKVKFETIDGLLIHLENEIFEVHDSEAFIAWLELKTRTVLSTEMLNNFLNGKSDFSSFAISNAIKELK